MTARTLVAWVALSAVLIAPVAIAAVSPLLAFRGTAYVAAGIAGAASLSILLLQPLLAGGYLPGLTRMRARRWHRAAGAMLILAVTIHVGGLYLTSPPDTLDALLLVSPTSFSIYGVTAIWAVVLTVLLVALRRRLTARFGLPPRWWPVLHNGLAVVVVGGTVAHALLIDGTMGTVSKTLISVAVLAATAFAVIHLRFLRRRPARA